MAFRTLSSGKFLLRNGKFALVGAAAAPPPPPAGVAATAITVAEVGVDALMFQRAGTSKAVQVSFTSNGTNLDARIVHPRTGATLLDWTPLVSGHPGGAATANLSVPQGVLGKLQLRDGINNVLTAACALKFAVGERVLLIGQSNMAFMTTAESGYPLANLDTRQFVNSTPPRYEWTGGHDDTGVWPPNTTLGTYTTYTPGPGSIRGDGAVYMANYLSAGLGCAVALFPFAVVGSSTTSWLPPSGARWTLMAAALDASGNDIGSVIWYQGEDASSTYQADLQTIYDALKTRLGKPNLPFGVVVLGPTTNYAPEGKFGSTRAAQIAFVAANPNAFLIVATDGSLADNVHLTQASRNRVAKRCAKALLAKLAETPKPGPKITGASRSGVTVTVATSGATGALKDGAGGAGLSLLGFRFFDAGAGGAQISYTVSSISGNNLIFTLASNPVGALTMDYGMANLAFGSSAPNPASILYDSDTVPGDTLGLPLQPLAAITVT